MAYRLAKQPHVCMDHGRYYVRCLPKSVGSPGAFASRAAAEAWLKDAGERIAASKDTAEQPLLRACLTCGKGFESEGPHNRLCNGCRNRASYEAMPSAFSFGRANGRRKG